MPGFRTSAREDILNDDAVGQILDRSSQVYLPSSIDLCWTCCWRASDVGRISLADSLTGLWLSILDQTVSTKVFMSHFRWFHLVNIHSRI